MYIVDHVLSFVLSHLLPLVFFSPSLSLLILFSWNPIFRNSLMIKMQKENEKQNKCTDALRWTRMNNGRRKQRQTKNSFQDLTTTVKFPPMVTPTAVWFLNDAVVNNINATMSKRSPYIIPRTGGIINNKFHQNTASNKRNSFVYDKLTLSSPNQFASACALWMRERIPSHLLCLQRYTTRCTWSCQLTNWTIRRGSRQREQRRSFRCRNYRVRWTRKSQTATRVS